MSKRKFSLHISQVAGSAKRSVTLDEIKLLWVMAATCNIDEHRKFFNLKMMFYGGEFNKSIVVKRIPNGYLNQFKLS